ncbi:hypothetical protein DFH06DRAFT_1441434 [Mycena polygramma]|nr:hypothetical protein DFH06DRAFT_1441434 [Mycena polygramma]
MVSENSEKPTSPAALFAVPTRTEIQACWELCRLHNNIGFWVVWLPTAWSIAMVYRAQSEISGSDALLRAIVYVPLCFGIKSLIMTVDDLLDHDIDALVERTKNRAIPRGAISLVRAWMFFGLQVVAGVFLATRTLSTTALYVSMPAWPLYIIYPTCKGLMFKVGIFMGWSDLSVDGSVPWHILVPIYIGACLWTFSYETVYQHQDSCAVLTYGGILNNQGHAFYAGVALAGVVLFKSLLTTDVDCPEQCKTMFLSTPRVGQIILLGFVVDAVVHRFVDGIPF